MANSVPMSEKERRSRYRGLVVFLVEHDYGFSFADVARLFGVSRQAIRKVYNEAKQEATE